MADSTIKYKIFVDNESGTATIRDFKGQIVSAQVPLKQLRREFGNFAKDVQKVKFDRFSKELKKTTSASNNFVNASGGATSAVLELGRVVQDAPYGLRGMANNITQLASQMAFATKSAGGFKKALGQMGKAMLGPLGVVFAISAVVAALEFMEGNGKKTKKAIDSLNETFGEESTKLMVLKDALNDTNVSLETKTELIKKANEEFEGLNLSLDETGKLSEEASEKIDLLSLSFIKNAKARAIAKLIQDEMVKQAKVEARTAGESLKWYETAYYALRTNLLGASSGLSDAINRDKENQQEAISDSAKAIQKYMDMLKKNDGDLAKFLFGGKKKRGKAKKKSEAEILLDIYGIDTSDAARQKYIDKLVDMFDFDSVGKELEVAPKLSFELSEETKAGIDAYNKLVRDMISDKFNAQNIAEFTDGIKTALSGINDFTDALFDRQLVTEQNKTNELNAELNNRLLNENLSAEKRKDIQNQIAQNDEKLRKKQNEIKKKAFNTNKAFQLSMAIADTASSVLKAYGSQLIVGDPTSIIRAKVAAGLAGAMGALQIATIATQKFQPDAATTPIRTSSGAGGSGGLGNRSFDFNLVGNNQGNQVVDAIQSQFDKPIKAYVVSKDITNAQQLDANTKSSARFGG